MRCGVHRHDSCCGVTRCHSVAIGLVCCVKSDVRRLPRLTIHSAHRHVWIRYVLLNLLGKGGFSEVWRAFDLVHAEDVAVKVRCAGFLYSCASCRSAVRDPFVYINVCVVSQDTVVVNGMS